MKKGLSSTVSIILLILTIILISGIVFVWARDVSSDNKERALGEKLCRDLELAVGDFCKGTTPVSTIRGNPSSDFKTYIKFSGRNDISGIKLYGFIIYLDSGMITSVPSLAYSEIGVGTSQDIRTDIIEDTTGLANIIIVPKIKPDKTIFTCIEKQTIINWDDMEEC